MRTIKVAGHHARLLDQNTAGRAPIRSERQSQTVPSEILSRLHVVPRGKRLRKFRGRPARFAAKNNLVSRQRSLEVNFPGVFDAMRSSAPSE